jgi:hypothetical protein
LNKPTNNTRPLEFVEYYCQILRNTLWIILSYDWIVFEMEKKSTRFYDLRFVVLVVIVLSIIAFKFYAGQAPCAASTAPASSTPSSQQAQPSQTAVPVEPDRATVH